MPSLELDILWDYNLEINCRQNIKMILKEALRLRRCQCPKFLRKENEENWDHSTRMTEDWPCYQGLSVRTYQRTTVQTLFLCSACMFMWNICLPVALTEHSQQLSIWNSSTDKSLCALRVNYPIFSFNNMEKEKIRWRRQTSSTFSSKYYRAPHTNTYIQDKPTEDTGPRRQYHQGHCIILVCVSTLYGVQMTWGHSHRTHSCW